MTARFLMTGALGSAALVGVAAAQGLGGYGAETQGFYVGAGYSYLNVEADDFDGLDESTNAVHLRTGYQFLPNFGAELEAAFGIDDGEFDADLDEDSLNVDLDGDEELTSILASEGDFGVDYLVGVYGKYTFPLSDVTELYARAGYAYLEAQRSFEVPGSDDDFDVSGGESGFAIGAGAAYDLTEASSLRADYTRYEFDDVAANGLNISYQYKFSSY